MVQKKRTVLVGKQMTINHVSLPQSLTAVLRTIISCSMPQRVFVLLHQTAHKNNKWIRVQLIHLFGKSASLLVLRHFTARSEISVLLDCTVYILSFRTVLDYSKRIYT